MTVIDEFFEFLASHRHSCGGGLVDLDRPEINEHGARLRGVCRNCAALFDKYLSHAEAQEFVRLIHDETARDEAFRRAERRIVQ